MVRMLLTVNPFLCFNKRVFPSYIIDYHSSVGTAIVHGSHGTEPGEEKNDNTWNGDLTEMGTYWGKKAANETTKQDCASSAARGDNATIPDHAEQGRKLS